MRSKNVKKCMKLNWNFQRGVGFLEKIPSVGRYQYFLGLHNTVNVKHTYTSLYISILGHFAF